MRHTNKPARFRDVMDSTPMSYCKWLLAPWNTLTAPCNVTEHLLTGYAAEAQIVNQAFPQATKQRGSCLTLSIQVLKQKGKRGHAKGRAAFKHIDTISCQTRISSY